MKTTSNRSTFVTVVAWIFIVLSGLGVLISIMQNAMVWVMARDFGEGLPLVFKLIFPAILLLEVWWLASAIGLLLRKNWARISFIVLLGLGILYMVGSTVTQWVLLARMPVSNDASFASIRLMMQIVTLVMALGVSLLFGWIIKRLRSVPIKAEFWGLPTDLSHFGSDRTLKRYPNPIDDSAQPRA